MITGIVALLRMPGGIRAETVAASGNAVSAIDAVLEEVRGSRDWWKSECEAARVDLEVSRQRCREVEHESEQWRARALAAEEKLRGGAGV